MSNNIVTLTGMGSLAVFLLGFSPAFGQIESNSGLIRITDKASNVSHQIHAMPASQVRQVNQQATINGGCQTGNCQSGQCQPAHTSWGGTSGYEGYCPDGHCPSGYGHQSWMMGPHLSGLCYGCTRSPGTGYVPPGKVPVKRQGVGYTQWYPSYWSGMGYGTQVPFNPAVAVPTDTTQLGYYYNHVPTWQPKPNMIPGIPHPNAWHVRRCGNQQCQAGCPVNHHGTVTQVENLKPVPDHINSPSGQTEAKSDGSMMPESKKSEAPKEVLPQPKTEAMPEPMARFPDFEAAEQATLVSFPDIETDLDSEE